MRGHTKRLRWSAGYYARVRTWLRQEKERQGKWKARWQEHFDVARKGSVSLAEAGAIASILVIHDKQAVKVKNNTLYDGRVSVQPMYNGPLFESVVSIPPMKIGGVPE